MSLLAGLSFGLRRKLPVILQTDAAESGLACLAMIAAFHGCRIDVDTLRRSCPVSRRGSTLADLMRIAERLELGTRPLKFRPDELGRLCLPCIVDSGGHFLVVSEVRGASVVVHDPADGVRTLPLKEIGVCLTGVALELWRNSAFVAPVEPRRVKVRELMGKVTGLYRALGYVLLMAIALELLGLLGPRFLQWVVDGGIGSADRELLSTLAWGFGLLLILQVMISTARSWVLMFMRTSMSIQWRANVLSHLLRLPMQYFQQRDLGDVASRFASVDRIRETLTASFIAAVLDGLMSIVTVAMMYSYSPALGSVAVIVMAMYAAGRWFSYRPLREATDAEIVLTARQDSHFLESVRAARTIKLFQREDARRSSWLRLLLDQVNANVRTQVLQIINGSTNSLLVGIENILIIWLGARMVVEGDFSIGMLLAFKAYKDQFDQRVSSVIDKLFQFRMLKLHGERLADIVLTGPERSAASRGSAEGEMRCTDIVITDLRFQYSEHEPMVLNGIDLHIREGESVAIAGSSGCGKTTLMNVVLGILQPTGGDVAIGGVSARKSGSHALRGIVGTVTQDDTLLAGSIADNISFFDPEADQEWVEACARAAAVHEDIAGMPMGYHSLVGDMGTVLSGGQRQRILLARALYRRPKILFLDEATSHLDVETERRVNAAIQALSITRVIIAHRPETIASANRVVTLANGRIVSESGGAPLATGLISTPPPVPVRKALSAAPTLPALIAAPAFMRLQ